MLKNDVGPHQSRSKIRYEWVVSVTLGVITCFGRGSDTERNGNRGRKGRRGVLERGPDVLRPTFWLFVVDLHLLTSRCTEDRGLFFQNTRRVCLRVRVPSLDLVPVKPVSSCPLSVEIKRNPVDVAHPVREYPSLTVSLRHPGSVSFRPSSPRSWKSGVTGKGKRPLVASEEWG